MLETNLAKLESSTLHSNVNAPGPKLSRKGSIANISASADPSDCCPSSSSCKPRQRVVNRKTESDFAVQNHASNRGMPFYELYGTDASAGAMTVWTWGMSRILDAVEMANRSNIDPAQVGITGCSRDGKGALDPGAFEERLVPAIPGQLGEGGTACWRLPNAEQAAGNVVPDFGRDCQPHLPPSFRPAHAHGHGRAARPHLVRQHRIRMARSTIRVWLRSRHSYRLLGPRRV